MTRARELANFADDTAGLETLTVSDITDLTATATELNKLDGVTADTSELNLLDGVTATTSELNVTDGVTVSTANINSAVNQITDSSTDLNVDSNTMVVDKSENKVGIGTSSPQGKLNIVPGNAVEGVRVSGANNTLGLSLAYTDAGHTHSYIYNKYSGNDDSDMILGFGSSYGSGTVMTLKKSGNVGIGKSPSTTLHIYKTGLADASTTALLTIDGKFVSNTIDSSDGAGIAFRLENALGGSQTTTCISSSYSASFNHLLLQAGGGNVGIGTTDPQSRLEIYGNNNTSASITLRNTNPNPDSHWQITPLYDSDVLAFRSANNSYANRMTISAGGDVTIPSGNVGIGYASPTQMLSIKQTVNDAYTPNDYNDKSLITLNVPNAEDNYAGIRFTHAGGTEGLFGYHRESSPTDRGEFVWQGYDGNANSYKEYMRLNWEGKLGIGGDPTGALLTGKNSGSNNAEIYLGATGTGNAGVVFDGSNGDFAGSDYYMLRQMNNLDVENWLGTSGDYIWKTNAGTERVRLKNDGTLKHVSGTTQLAHEQYSYGTSSFASNGNWHTMLSGLSGHHVFLVRMYQSGSGFHTSALFIAANTYASGNIWTFSSGAGWSSNVELRWTGSTYNYNLEGRSTGTNSVLTYWRIKLINI